MNYVILPLAQPTQYASVDDFPCALTSEVWSVLPPHTVGGYFVDHLVNSSGILIGIRFWLDGILTSESFLTRFASDPRFVFEVKQKFVDIFFNHVDRSNIGNEIETLQDIGRAFALKANSDRFALAFSLPSD